MRSYGVSMVPTGNGEIPCILPFYTVEKNAELEQESKPYTVVEILKERFQEDFEEAFRFYTRTCPQGIKQCLGLENVKELKLLRLNEPRVESTLSQSLCSMAVDLIFMATYEVSARVNADHKDSTISYESQIHNGADHGTVGVLSYG